MPVEELPDDILIYLLGSRYCETDRLIGHRLGAVRPYRSRAGAGSQAIVDFVHSHIEFGYHHARPTKTAWDAHQERRGVCRDFAHLAITLCRCMNIPARYCTGYLRRHRRSAGRRRRWISRAWFDVYLGGDWHAFDARHNQPRIGRILMARGRDATDTALTTAFGPAKLVSFKVHADEVQTVESA